MIKLIAYDLNQNNNDANALLDLIGGTNDAAVQQARNNLNHLINEEDEEGNPISHVVPAPDNVPLGPPVPPTPSPSEPKPYQEDPKHPQ